MIVGEDAQIGGGLHRFARDRTAVELGVLHEDPRGGEGVVAAGADGDDVVVGLDDVAGARQQQEEIAVGGEQQGFEAA
ncbi:hypothetical protein D3C83_177250 [compost metagenome]